MPDFARAARVRLDQAIASSTSGRHPPPNTPWPRKRAWTSAKQHVRRAAGQRSNVVVEAVEHLEGQRAGVIIHARNLACTVGWIVDRRENDRAVRHDPAQCCRAESRTPRRCPRRSLARRRGRLPYAVSRSVPPIVSVTQHRLRRLVETRQLLAEYLADRRAVRRVVLERQPRMVRRQIVSGVVGPVRRPTFW